MTTDFMETWSLEEGDQILINDTVYKILEIGTDADRNYLLFTVDEEGYRHTIAADGAKKFRLVLDNLESIG